MVRWVFELGFLLIDFVILYSGWGFRIEKRGNLYLFGGLEGWGEGSLSSDSYFSLLLSALNN